MKPTQRLPSDEAWQVFVDRSDSARVGIVSAIAPFGVFVRFEEGVDGLLHSTAEPRRDLQVGDEVQVRVLGLDADKRRASLQEA